VEDATWLSFYDATVEMGVANKVTTFTASDFGRTLASNGDGSDHGWGSHHLVWAVRSTAKRSTARPRPVSVANTARAGRPVARRARPAAAQHLGGPVRRGRLPNGLAWPTASSTASCPTSAILAEAGTRSISALCFDAIK